WERYARWALQKYRHHHPVQDQEADGGEPKHSWEQRRKQTSGDFFVTRRQSCDPSKLICSRAIMRTDSWARQVNLPVWQARKMLGAISKSCNDLRIWIRRRSGRRSAGNRTDGKLVGYLLRYFRFKAEGIGQLVFDTPNADVRLFRHANKVSKDAGSFALGLNLPQHNIFRMKRRGDGVQVALCARQTKDLAVADDGV